MLDKKWIVPRLGEFCFLYRSMCGSMTCGRDVSRSVSEDCRSTTASTNVLSVPRVPHPRFLGGSDSTISQTLWNRRFEAISLPARFGVPQENTLRIARRVGVRI